MNSMGDDSIRARIDQRAVSHSNAVYLIDPDNELSVSFGDLRRRARRIAEYLTHSGYKKSASIGYASFNGVGLVQAILGCLYGGFRVVSINLVAGRSTIDYVLSHSGCRLVLCDAANYAMMAEIIAESHNEIKIIKIDDLPALADSKEPYNVALAEPESHDDGLLIYTSGTTGRPKGVVLSHENLLAGGSNTALAHALTEQDRGLCSLPLYHINAFCVSMLASFLSCQSLVVPGKFSASNFWSLVHKYQCSWFSLVPTQIAYILHHPSYVSFDRDLSRSVRFGRSASSSLAPALQRDFEEKFGVYIIETLGLSESSAQVTANPLPPRARKEGSCGIAFGNEIKIADSRLHEVSANTEGEILVRGANVMKGYYKDEEATARSFTADGWFRTGDLGRLDDEGYLFITGRLKELIIKGGENIAPREIDEVLYRHPCVIEAAAFACPCDDYGQDIEACVAVASDVDTEKLGIDLLLSCHSALGKFKSPSKIHFLDELPKGPSGKIQRLKLYAIIHG